MKRIINYIVVIFTIILLGEFSVYAEEGIGGFTIEGVPNTHQLDKNVGYFYLTEEPGSTDQLKVKLINESSQEKTLEVKITDAATNSNGIIDYTGTIKNNKLLIIPLSSLIKVDSPEVKVPANNTKEVSFQINMPRKDLKGVVLGGIVVSEKKDKNKGEKKLSIENSYSYTLGVVLTNEIENKLKQNISVELEKVGPILHDGRRIVEAKILNPNPYIFSDARVEGSIIDQKTKEEVRIKEQKNVNIAPYSSFPFQFDWEKEDLKPGKYLFKCKVASGKKEWKFEKNFKITEKQAQNINEKSVFQIIIPKWLSTSSIILSLLSFISIVFLFIRRRKKGIFR
ncbi:hypothetical protein A5806_002495 [Enterococcus faecium]|uniref:DUF916 and DUF3324 domain-containing protein n=1 Tax=Enterococcus faecium TaxID=1352 RepID=UPI000B3E7C10|nr:DUF916 and DUF3324 domain-containing protein [Enterococcus faecium]OUZ27887.1 hypothetical protein A5806_002495 [Enterococcus faecium]